jgi:tryprostatin B 6-hydroxylase
MLDPKLYLFLAVFGVLAHLLYFHRGEHHLYGNRYLGVAVLTWIASVSLQMRFVGASSNLALSNTLHGSVAFAFGLISSTVLFRLIFSPLRKFDGPFTAKLTGLWFTFQLGGLDAYRQLQNFHGKYGDIVQIGPNTLSIVLPGAYRAIHGPKSKCTKSSMFDITYPDVSLQSGRDREEHDRRRKLWVPAFTGQKLLGYEERLSFHRQLLLESIDKKSPNPINQTALINYFTYDVMGDLAFGKSFRMLESEEEHFALMLLKRGLFIVGYVIPIWVTRMIIGIPGAQNDWNTFSSYCAQQLDERIQVMQPPLSKT